ncbi:MAG: glycosyltransferase [candidate division Zixibacteria bacterium]|nr:glycosyltransferase [candidate division Zixibacteria bacterium]
MRLLLITNRYPASADDPASPFVPHFVGALQRRGPQVDILTPSYRPISWEGEAPAEPSYIHRFPVDSSTPIGSWNFAHPMAWFRLYRFMRDGYAAGERLCRANDYDHILALWALPSGYFARSLARQFHIPYSVWCLGSDIYAWARRPLIRGRIATVLRNATCVFGDGEDLCQRAKEQFRVECRFLPSFRPLDLGTVPNVPVPTAVPKYLYLGRLHRAKGIFDLISAFAIVRQSLPQATLHFVGDGPDGSALRRLRREQGMDSIVGVAGPVGQSQIVTALAESDFLVIPTKSDSLPLVFSEAVSMNRPVIGTDVGDLGTFIRRFRVGLVAPTNDSVGLAAAMLEMARAPVFDPHGRADLLNLLDPDRAAETFCRTVFPERLTIEHTTKRAAPVAV